MNPRVTRSLAALLTASALVAVASDRPPATREPDRLVVSGIETGKRGGRLVIALRSEPKTLNPLTAGDSASKDVIGRMAGSLIEVDRQTQSTRPALAKRWSVSSDGRRYTLELRRGLRFSDGHPLDADDVLFSFESYLDERNGSPQRDTLIVGGQPIRVRKADASTVVFELAQPYAPGERLFDSLAILPRHLLGKAATDGKLSQAWGLGVSPAEIAGLGPFRLKSYMPGERVVLERNPYYWKADRSGNALPYLDEVTFLLVPSEDAQVIRFQAGETDVISRLSAENFEVLSKEQQARHYRMQDLGPGLEYSFFFFNLNDKRPDALARQQRWFRQEGFRQAVSAALDREGMVRLALQGRASPLGTHVTPGNKLWVNRSLSATPRSLARARELLKGSGFSWKDDGTLADSSGEAVEFSILVSAQNGSRVKMATIIQDDLRELGIRAHVVPLENRAVIDRVLNSHDYEACVLAFGGGDADPSVEMNVWLSSGATHVWNLGQPKPATPWEAEIDRLMGLQLTALKYEERKKLYDRVQELVAEHLPVIPLVAPHILVGAKDGLLNFRPSILDHYTLWNVDELSWRTGSSPRP